MKVKLRERVREKSISLYLDMYDKGKRKIEMLNLSLHKSIDNVRLTKQQIQENKNALMIADSIRAKRLLELQSGLYGIGDFQKLDESFVTYLKSLRDKRGVSNSNYSTWDSMIKHVLKYLDNQDVTFRQVDKGWIDGFKLYLDGTCTSNGIHLSQNTKFSYFSKLKTGLKEAIKEGIIIKNPSLQAANIKQGDNEREFLTKAEVEALIKAKCELPILKKAFLFSCMTGLRFSDIEELIWGEVQFSDEYGHYLRFKQKKSKGNQTLPIVEQARKVLGDSGDSSEIVFTNLKYSAWNNTKLKEWILRAGINKNITFHCARHTYATLLLTQGAEIHTVSKMLGHKELKTTQVYAKIIDSKKREAADKIDLVYEY